jgi:POT family proton-dependent oligopeptide transporter
MKSLVMAFFLLSVAAGNPVTAAVNGAIAWSTPARGAAGQALLQGAAYYWFFAGMMLATAIGFLFVLKFYQGKTYIQGTKPQPTEV